MPSATPAGTVLAFDFGTERIGVAVGETQLGVAHPLTTLSNHADGTPHAMTARARRFARQLQARFALPVALGDERYTTQTASSALRGAATRARKRKAARDRVAAQLILQAYLDGRLAS